MVFGNHSKYSELPHMNDETYGWLPSFLVDTNDDPTGELKLK